MKQRFLALAVLCLGSSVLAGPVNFHPHQFLYDKNGKLLPESMANSSQVNWRLLSSGKDRQYRSMGVVVTNGDPRCSVTLLNTGSRGSGPAYALTAGHCIDGFPRAKNKNPRKVLVDFAPKQKMAVRLNYFADAPWRARDVAVRRVAYAANSWRDLALLELAEPYEKLAREGFGGFAFDPEIPEVGASARFVAVPANGDPQVNNIVYWLPENVTYLRASDCKVNSVQLYRFQEESILFDCSILRGASGGALLSQKTGKILGVLSQYTPLERVERELSPELAGVVAGNNAASSTAVLSRCFDDDGRFQFRKEGCILPQACDDEKSVACDLENCEGGDGWSCWNAGWKTLLGRGGTQKDPVKAAELYRKGCTFKNGPACHNLAMAYVKGEGVGKSEEAALTYFTLGRGLHAPQSALALGTMHYNGLAVEKSFDEARRFYGEACRGEVAVGCLWYALGFIGVDPEKEGGSEATQALVRGCFFGSAEACSGLAGFFESGKTRAKNPVIATRLYKRACDLGEKESCGKTVQKK